MHCDACHPKTCFSQQHVASEKQGSFNSDNKKQRMVSPAIIYFSKKPATHILCLSRYPIRSSSATFPATSTTTNESTTHRAMSEQ
jgi:hypothetical protein